jgi:diguanylate cyclase (GGDEF)-like protein
MAELTKRLWEPLSSRSILPLTARDRRAFFRMATIARSIAICVLGAVLLWSLRDSSPVALVVVAVWMYPGAVITWLIFRRTGSLPPHLWMRDLVSLTVFAALIPDYLVVAMMACLAILAFNCYTVERRTTMILSISAGLGMSIAALANVSDMSALAALVFPLAIVAIVVPTQMSATAMHRSLAFNASIADALGVAMFETSGEAGAPATLSHLYASEARRFGPVITEAEWLSILHPDDRAISDQIDAAVARGEDYHVRYRQQGDDGEYRWIEEIGRVDHSGNTVKVYGMTRDVTSKVDTETRLMRLDLMADMVDVSISLLRLVDPDDPTSLTVVWENQAATRVDGRSHVGQRVIDFNSSTFDAEGHRGLGYRMAEVAAGGATWRVSDANIRLHGEPRKFSLVVSPLPDRHCAVVMQDITELFEARAELERLAFVDTLTELPNRARFRRLLAEAPVGSQLFVMDLDRFTDVNEAFGHGCGDELISAVARILDDRPDGAVVARLGGDEFGVLTPPDLGRRDELVARIFHALSRPVTLPNGLTLQASASMGITAKTKIDTPPDELLRQADVALNHAKRIRNTHEVYDARVDNSAPHRMMLLGELRRALVSGELELHHQPAIDSATGMISSVEALLVWRHPSLGLLSANDLTEMVDLSNLRSEVVLYSLREAVSHYRMWRDAGRAVPVSINVSGSAIHDAGLVGRLIEVLLDADIPRHAIGIEIAEPQLALSQGSSQEALIRLRDAGFWVTIDHFGASITSLAALQASGANALKVDRRVIDGFLRPIGPEMVRAVVNSCRAAGVVLAAEGADDEETFDWLMAQGIDQVQGSFVSPPLDAHEMTTFLSSHALLDSPR